MSQPQETPQQMAAEAVSAMHETDRMWFRGWINRDEANSMVRLITRKYQDLVGLSEDSSMLLMAELSRN